MNDARRVVVHLNCISGVGPATVKRLIEVLGTNLPDLYSYGVGDIQQSAGLSAAPAERLVEGLKDIDLLEQELRAAERTATQIITCLDPEYPFLLAHTYAPPPVLYVQGRLVQHQKVIAIVGARNATLYGKRVLESLVPELVQHGWHIISGGAVGIDTYAHEATLAAGGQTTAVCGSGLLYTYPAANRSLFKKMQKQEGAIISNFAMAMQPVAANFPARNRIIAGMAKACLVVQAAAKSGSLITAAYALEYGREVCAVPGMFDDMRSAGCHHLLRQGAHLIDSPEQLLTILGETVTSKQSPTSTLLAQQDPLLAYLQQPICLDELLDLSGKSLPELQSALVILQLEGKVTQNAAGLWHLI